MLLGKSGKAAVFALVLGHTSERRAPGMEVTKRSGFQPGVSACRAKLIKLQVALCRPRTQCGFLATACFAWMLCGTGEAALV